MNNTYPVSICIPTYNRAKYLKNTLQSIITQQPFLDGRVEVAVTDNVSDDGTESMCRAYAEQYPNFNYYRNTVNIHDKNFPTCLKNAHGELRKLCNDTLIFNPDFLEDLCRYADIYSSSKPLLFFENGLFDRQKIGKKFSRAIGEPGETPNTTKPLSFNDFMMRDTYWITSIAQASFWDTDCVGEDDEELFRLQLWQVSKIAELLSTGRKVISIKKQYFNVQDFEKSKQVDTVKIVKTYYENFFSILNPYFEKGILTQQCKEIIEKDLLLNFFSQRVTEHEIDPMVPKEKVKVLEHAIYEKYGNKDYYKEYKLLLAGKRLKKKLKR